MKNLLLFMHLLPLLGIIAALVIWVFRPKKEKYSMDWFDAKHGNNWNKRNFNMLCSTDCKWPEGPMINCYECNWSGNCHNCNIYDKLSHTRNLV